jgi:hypothetical protein
VQMPSEAECKTQTVAPKTTVVLANARTHNPGAVVTEGIRDTAETRVRAVWVPAQGRDDAHGC